MKSLKRTLFVQVLALAILSGCSSDNDKSGSDGGPTPDSKIAPDAEGDVTTEPDATQKSEGQVWIANRAGGSVSVIDVATDEVIDTLELPDDGEPMYINYSEKGGRVFVGDRRNNRVLVYKAGSRELDSTVTVGEGVFHQWTSPDFERLYVNNDVDKTTSVIDAKMLEVSATIPMPDDLAALGGKPHDVFVDPSGAAVFISYLGFSGDHDYVVRFETTRFEETHRAKVGKDPHLSATATNNYLYVPCQETNEVIVLERSDLSRVKTLEVPGAHGAIMDPEGATFYTTNLPGGGKDAVYVIKTADNALAQDKGVDGAEKGAAHNLALTADGAKLYMTHSGAEADTVSVFNVDPKTMIPSLAGEITVGKNPFGLGFVPPDGMETKEYRKLLLNVSSLSTLRDGHHYEGWAIFDGKPVSTGKFNVDASGVATDLQGIAIPNGEFDAGRDLTKATALVITIEVPGDVDIVPNESHYLAGNLSGRTSILTTKHPDALGIDLNVATGKYILATPTDGPDNNETSGVWFLSLQMTDPVAGLQLPTLPAGWKYEGWAVVNGKPLSTGKFTKVDVADDATPFSATTAGGPPFPGEDFLVNAPSGVTFPVDLSDSNIVISVEPDPDDGEEPFLLKPLVGTVPANAADHQTFDLMNQAATNLPVITATLRE